MFCHTDNNKPQGGGATSSSSLGQDGLFFLFLMLFLFLIRMRTRSASVRHFSYGLGPYLHPFAVMLPTYTSRTETRLSCWDM